MKARLYTTTEQFEKGGEYVVDENSFVTELEVLPYNRPPDVLLWGTRFFVYVGDRDLTTIAAAPHVVYREAFAVAPLPHDAAVWGAMIHLTPPEPRPFNPDAVSGQTHDPKD